MSERPAHADFDVCDQERRRNAPSIGRVHSHVPLNATEQFVFDICRGSFLSLWSYANPRGKSAGRELCDVLVICDPDVIIFSVKEAKVAPNADPMVQFQRWRRKAIEESAAQLYGAERWINTSGQTNVVRSDGTLGLPYPPAERRRIHRVAIALGGGERFPLSFDDRGKGFIHVFDERGCDTILRELDTIGDFVAYLRAKEEFFGTHDVLCPGEENLLAVYLNRGRVFPTVDQPIFIEPDSWQKLTNRPEYKAKQVEDRPSHIWDNLVEIVGRDVVAGNLEFPPALTDSEKALRVMARENRFARRMLGKAFSDFLRYAADKRLDSRMMKSRPGVGYVFLVSDNDAAVDRKYRNAALGLRCLVARNDMPDCSTIIGIGTERPSATPGFSFDIVYMHLPKWSPADVKRSEELRAEFGYFRSPIQTHIHENDYPGT